MQQLCCWNDKLLIDQLIHRLLFPTAAKRDQSAGEVVSGSRRCDGGRRCCQCVQRRRSTADLHAVVGHCWYQVQVSHSDLNSLRDLLQTTFSTSLHHVGDLEGSLLSDKSATCQKPTWDQKSPLAGHRPGSSPKKVCELVTHLVSDCFVGVQVRDKSTDFLGPWLGPQPSVQHVRPDRIWL